MAKRQFAGGSSESHYRNYAKLGTVCRSVEPRSRSKSRAASGWLHGLPRRSNHRPLEIISGGHSHGGLYRSGARQQFCCAAGALRIDSVASGESPLKHVAFRNLDGSIVLLALNPSGSAITLSIAWQSQYATYTLQPGAVVTFHWLPKLRTRR